MTRRLDVEKMSPAQRLEAMERLWDAICRQVPAPPSPAWHEEVLKARKARAESGQAGFLDMNQVQARLRPPPA